MRYVLAIAFICACLISWRLGAFIALCALALFTLGFIEAGADAKSSGRSFWQGLLFGSKKI